MISILLVVIIATHFLCLFLVSSFHLRMLNINSYNSNNILTRTNLNKTPLFLDIDEGFCEKLRGLTALYIRYLTR